MRLQWISSKYPRTFSEELDPQHRSQLLEPAGERFFVQVMHCQPETQIFQFGFREIASQFFVGFEEKNTVSCCSLDPRAF